MTSRRSLKACFAGGAIAAVLALALGAPPARAACGDYVAYKLSAVRPDDGHFPAPTGHEADPGPAPCRGPNCSRAPDVPITPVAPPSSQPEDWGCEWHCAILSAPGASGALADVGGPRPVRRAPTIFHPPR